MRSDSSKELQWEFPSRNYLNLDSEEGIASPSSGAQVLSLAVQDVSRRSDTRVREGLRDAPGEDAGARDHGADETFQSTCSEGFEGPMEGHPRQ